MNRVRIFAVVVVSSAIVIGYFVMGPRQPDDDGNESAYRGWPAYGGGPEQTRYSALSQIDRSNVQQLEVAWTYDTQETGGLQTNPIVIGDVLYVPTPSHQVIALDAATGTLRWKFDSGIPGRGPNRGVMFWASGNEERIYTAQGQYLYALDARTGQPVVEFGREGRIDLHEDLGRDPKFQSVFLTTPGVVYKDLLIIGSRVGESLPSSPGHIRAYDARTGRLRWTFHTIPHPGEFGYETWPESAWLESGGANSWPGLALDSSRGVVFVPTGSAASDFYGADRHGDNLFANSLIALNADTGERTWHFQVVRHDLWDRDLPSPPSLVTVTRQGRQIDAVAQTTKHGYVFLFDRTDGTPLFPIEYREYPASDIEGERSASMQPLPTKPSPFARQSLTEDMLTDRTPEARQIVLERFRTLRSQGQFLPLAVGQETVVFPGFDGGAEWGGAAFDPETNLLYVNANEMAWSGGLAINEAGRGGRRIYLRECAACHGDELAGAPPEIPSLTGLGEQTSADELSALIRRGAGRMVGFPQLPSDELAALIRYLVTGESIDLVPALDSEVETTYRFTGYKKLLDPDGYPAITPPWGTLNAIDLDTGEYVWRVPLGEYPELDEAGVPDTGSENYGGPVVTAGGLVFIGATNFDKKFRAFDKATGELLWETVLPYSANGTPATYELDGRQFIVVPSGGGKSRPNVEPESGGVYVTFALPRD